METADIVDEKNSKDMHILYSRDKETEIADLRVSQTDVNTDVHNGARDTDSHTNPGNFFGQADPQGDQSEILNV